MPNFSSVLKQIPIFEAQILLLAFVGTEVAEWEPNYIAWLL